VKAEVFNLPWISGGAGFEAGATQEFLSAAVKHLPPENLRTVSRGDEASGLEPGRFVEQRGTGGSRGLPQQLAPRQPQRRSRLPPGQPRGRTVPAVSGQTGGITVLPAAPCP